MAVKQTGDGTGHLQTVESTKAARTVVIPKGTGFTITATTGTVSAGAATTDGFFMMKVSPGASVAAYVTRITTTWTTITGFSTLTAGRRLLWGKGWSTVPLTTFGASTVPIPAKKLLVDPISACTTPVGGDTRFAVTTAGFSLSGVANAFHMDGAPFSIMLLVGQHVAGSTLTKVYTGDGSQNYAVKVNPSELIICHPGQNMDATGTWQVSMTVDWYEALP